MPIVTEIDESMTIRQVLMRVRETLIEAYGRQQYPVTRLIRDLKIEDSATHCPLFEFAVCLQGFHLPLADVKNDVTVNVSSAEEIKVTFVYNSALFRRTSIESLAEHFVHLLAAALRNMSAKISDLELVMPIERDGLLMQCKHSEIDCSRTQTAHRLFERQVGTRPEAVAVTFEDTTLTYDELNGQANQFARYLRMLGVGAETIVGVALERSVDMVVAVLGVLKAGGAYLPLDTTHPAERLRMILEETKTGFVVTQSELATCLPAHTARHVLIDRERQSIENQAGQTLYVRLTEKTSLT